MDKLERRRLDRLNKEYRVVGKSDYSMLEGQEPIFNSRRLFWMTLFAGIGVAMVAWGLL